MNIQIRRAVKEDCQHLLELIDELAVFEKAPQEVTVTLEHFIESGFGPNPVWWGFVAVDRFEGKEENSLPLRCITSVIQPGKDKECTSKTFSLRNNIEAKGLANYFLIA